MLPSCLNRGMARAETRGTMSCAVRRFTFLASLLALVVAALCVEKSARAQNITVTTTGGGVTRSVAKHTPSSLEYVISKADCLSADNFNFPYTAMNFSGLNVEVWMDDSGSLSCDQAAARDQTATGAHCTQLFSTTADKSGVITIASSLIASKVSTVTMPGCNDSNGSSLARPLTLYFMLVTSGGGNLDPTNFTKWTQGSLDMLGPPAPTNLMGGSADQGITLTYQTQNIKDTLGYYVYCDPPPGGTATTGAGATTGAATTGATTSATTGATTTAATTTSTTSTGTAGGSGSTTSTTTTAATTSATTAAATSTVTSTTATGAGGAGSSNGCTSSVLVPGQIPSSAYICGKASGPSATALGLVNDMPYAVGVAAYDNVGNVGPLSQLLCATPQQVDDFFTNYRNAGGQAGNCACSTSGSELGWETSLLSGLIAYAAIGRRTRRRRRS